MRYVLVNIQKPTNIIGPFRTLVAAQQFRKVRNAEGVNMAAYAAVGCDAPDSVMAGTSELLRKCGDNGEVAALRRALGS